MPYIGNTVQSQGFTPAIDYFSGNGVTVTFTLSRPVISPSQMIVAIDNVIQNPSSAFTVSGSSITFTSAPLSGTNNIWVEYTSLITTYAALSQDPSVIGDITASGGFLATGDFGNSYIDGTIVDYVTGAARITTGPLDNIVFYHGGSYGRSEIMRLSYTGAIGVGSSTSYGTSGQVLTSSGSSSSPTWATVASSQWTTSGSNIYYTTGNVGIGTSSPGVNLEVKSGGSPNIKASSDSNVYAYLTLNTWALDRAQIRGEGANPGAGSGTGSGVMSFWTANNSALAERGRFDGSGNFQFNSGYGSVATAYGCRAWVNFNGNSYAIRGSGNVSSITHIATGVNQINFTTAMPDTSYSVSGFGASGTISNSYYGGDPWVGTTTYCYLWTNYGNSGYDLDWSGCQVFR